MLKVQEITRLRSELAEVASNPVASREELARVLGSRAFSGSERLRNFLRFATEFALDTPATPLKELRIGIELYKIPDYDPKTLATVRVDAGRLRQKLLAYYSDEGAANPARTNEFLRPIRIERTRDTGLKHRDGTLSMARDGPDSAQDEFFICIGDQPELDFGGKRNPDGQGFAAFGQVTKGMEVVRRIQGSPAEGQTLTPPIRIVRMLLQGGDSQ